jgi:hypothetical protein
MKSARYAITGTDLQVYVNTSAGINDFVLVQTVGCVHSVVIDGISTFGFEESLMDGGSFPDRAYAYPTEVLENELRNQTYNLITVEQTYTKKDIKNQLEVIKKLAKLIDLGRISLTLIKEF